MAHDLRYDAPGALALGGAGALTGLMLSGLTKNQRKHRLRNMLLGATVLPGAYIGGKYLASKRIENGEDLYKKDPIYQYISAPILSKLQSKFPTPYADKDKDLTAQIGALASKQIAADNEVQFDDISDTRKSELANTSQELENAIKQLEREQAALRESGISARDYNSFLNNQAALNYGILGAGIGLPALYLAHLNKKKKKREQLA